MLAEKKKSGANAQPEELKQGDQKKYYAIKGINKELIAGKISAIQ